ncbi:MAG: two-component sensor histidine kinase [Nocardiopsaceae bacterium]|nr:two-component sensor histidine kinase [Nocardiopsaceae bacterium]
MPDSAMPGSAARPEPPLLARVWPRMARRLADRPAGPDLLDAALAAGCFIAFTGPVLPGKPSVPVAAVAAGFGVMASAPLILRRKWPVPVALVVTAVLVAAALADVAFTPFVSNAGPALAIAVFTVAVHRGRRRSLAVAVVAGAATWASLPLAIHLHPGHDQDAVQLIAAAVGWVTGDTVRSFRWYQGQLRLLQRRQAAEELRLARVQERLRLTREVHDVVSHSLSTIAVQAGVARLVLDREPGQAGTALSAIETASRSALDELRGLLRQIRDPDEAAEAATPTLADLPALIDRLRAAGLPVTCRSTGRARSYGGAVEFSAYRIAQEALTNVTKHASGARTRVEIAHGPDSLTLTVTNDRGRSADRNRPAGNPPAGDRPAGDRSAGDRGGLGLPGMRERAELLGGTLSAAPGPDGGFRVTAWLPAGKRRDGTGPRASGEPE